jgi:diguanylate cyclase (GGDEF)-like protein
MNLGQLEQLIAEIRRLSFADDKTSLGNALALDREGQLLNDGKSEFDVIMFGDLNDFKHLNDLHGHDAGDIAIRAAGEAIRKLAIEELEAQAFRQSGDEFVILLKQGAMARFISAAASLGSIKFSHYEDELATAMSLGYVHTDGKISFRDLLTRAETACQYAKAQGDGACIEWVEDMERNPLLRIAGRCLDCAARISCNVLKQNAPSTLTCCPCCGGTALA